MSDRTTRGNNPKTQICMEITPSTFQETTVLLVIDMRTSELEELELIILPRSTLF
jgi:hypothetical protein